MAEIYLHHYPESPFSEKVRLVLGFLDLEWKSVVIPMIMPRPKLMPLSGGYRRTPVGQIGANVYCDSKLIIRALAERAGNEALAAPDFAAHRVADWADSHLFRVIVALNFRPEAMAARMAEGGGFGDVDPAAFAKDRAELTAGADLVGFSASVAEGYLLHALDELEARMTAHDFLVGDAPSIADFAVYHCLWFLRGSTFNAHFIESRKPVVAFMERMAAMGHGTMIDSDADAALAEAKASEPVLPEPVVRECALEIGQTAQVAPADYGKIPVSGELVCADAYQIALRRETDETGPIVTAFPRAGFEVGA